MRIVASLAVCILLTACVPSDLYLEPQPVPVQQVPTTQQETQQYETPEEDDSMPNRHAIIETNKGTIKIELFESKAPQTTANFIKLAQQGFYDEVTFHRVIPDFMIQGGDPTGTGRGVPGYSIDDEFGIGLRHHKAGILSMANSGPNTGGSQFFITLAPTPWLDGKHAVFGEVVEGLDVVVAISEVERDSSDKPVQPVVMRSVKIE